MLGCKVWPEPSRQPWYPDTEGTGRTDHSYSRWVPSPERWETQTPFPVQFSLEFNSPLTWISFWSPTSHTMHFSDEVWAAHWKDSFILSCHPCLVKVSLVHDGNAQLVWSAWLTHHRLYFEGTIAGNPKCKNQCECTCNYLTVIAWSKHAKITNFRYEDDNGGLVVCAHRNPSLLKTEGLRAGLQHQTLPQALLRAPHLHWCRCCKACKSTWHLTAGATLILIVLLNLLEEVKSIETWLCNVSPLPRTTNFSTYITS